MNPGAGLSRLIIPEIEIAERLPVGVADVERLHLSGRLMHIGKVLARHAKAVPAISLNSKIEKYIGYCILRERGGRLVAERRCGGLNR